MSTKTLQILCVCLAAALLLSLLAYTLYDSYLSKLDIPEVTRVFMRLKEMGLDVPPVHTLQQAVAEMQKLKEGDVHA